MLKVKTGAEVCALGDTADAPGLVWKRTPYGVKSACGRFEIDRDGLRGFLLLSSSFDAKYATMHDAKCAAAMRAGAALPQRRKRQAPGIPHCKETYAAPNKYGERNDCSVRALATVMGISYEQSHLYFAVSGRQQGHGTHDHVSRHAWRIALAGKDPIHAEVKGTLRRVLATLDPVGHYVLHTSTHAFAVVAGVVHDWRARPTCRVEHVFRFDTVRCD